MSRVRDELVRAAYDVDGALAAVLMSELLRSGRLSQALARELVAPAWDLTGWPMAVLSRERWVGLFRHAGFTREGVLAEPPAEPVVLFRGSDEWGAEGMCWSTNVDVALWLASKYDEGWVWRAEVEPWRLLAFVAATYEDQWVVDTTDLEMEVVYTPEQVAEVDADELADRLDALVEERHGTAS